MIPRPVPNPEGAPTARGPPPVHTPATAEPPNSSRRVRTRPLVPQARSTREAANPQQPVDGPKATIRAATLPFAQGPLKVSAVATRQATPTAPQTHAPFR